MPNAYDKTYMDGNLVDEFMAQSLRRCEKALGYELTIIQGSYNAGGVSASAGTHDGGGAVDLSAFDWERKCKVLRKNGWAAWHRLPLPGVWGEHIHAVQYDNAKLSSGARSQVSQYYNHTNGLADYGWDSQWRPKKIPHFKFDAKPPKPKLYGDQVNRARINRSIKAKNIGEYEGATAMKQMRVVYRHIKDQTKLTVEGFDNHPSSALSRAIEKISGKRKLDRKTARKLLLKSHWAPLPEWKKNNGPKHKRR